MKTFSQTFSPVSLYNIFEVIKAFYRWKTLSISIFYCFEYSFSWEKKQLYSSILGSKTNLERNCLNTYKNVKQSMWRCQTLLLTSIDFVTQNLTFQYCNWIFWGHHDKPHHVDGLASFFRGVDDVAVHRDVWPDLLEWGHRANVKKNSEIFESSWSSHRGNTIFFEQWMR